MHLPDLEYDWTRIYGDVLEEIPKDAPEPLGKSVTTTTFLDPNLDRIPSTNAGAEPPRDARDSGSARSHSTHLETSSSNRP